MEFFALFFRFESVKKCINVKLKRPFSWVGLLDELSLITMST